jgi:hypothetical protein
MLQSNKVKTLSIISNGNNTIDICNKIVSSELKFYMNSNKIKRTEQLIVIHIHEDAENCKIPNAEILT